MVKTKKYFFISLLIIIKYSNCFVAFPFDTIFMKNSSISPQNDYRAQMLQNELYVNVSLGSPPQNIKLILKMDLYGFVIYNGAFNRNLSNSYELVDTERRLTCFPQIKSFTSKDYFYVPSFNSYNEFITYISNSKNKSTFSKIVKTEKSLFIWAKKLKDSVTKFNDIYENYGVIGLKLNFNKYFIAPEFVYTSFKGIENIKTHTFYLRFNDNKINGFFNSNNNGYFIFGEEITDDENEKKNIKYTRARERLDDINWDLAFDDIISKSKENETIEYRPEYKHAEFYVNFPYLLGPRHYNAFISKVFFHELVIERICDYTYGINGGEYAGYKCDSNSKIFMENLNKKFPDLIFEHKELGEKFIFTKNDLFTYNIYNKSDTYLYFVILFPQLKGRFHPMSWILGIPFLKKYIFTFNYDNNMIGYYKKENSIPVKTSIFFFFRKENSLIIIIFILSIIFGYILGILSYKKINKKPRKTKANELDENFEYIKGNKDINLRNNTKNKQIELTNKLIN